MYNSNDKCSLVINGTVVDQYIGEIATRFTLQGKIKTDEKEILVQAKMGFFYMSIFYDNVCVAKKCMALG